MMTVIILPRSKVVRYCLSDGRTWIFSLYVKDEQGRRVSYEGDPFTIIEPRPDAEDAFNKDIQTVAELLYHWVRDAKLCEFVSSELFLLGCF